MHEHILNWTPCYFSAYKEQLMALGIVPGVQDSAARAFADLKAELVREKAAQETAWVEIDTLTRAVKDLKITTDKFAAQIPTLEEKIKHLENKLLDEQKEVRAKEISLERTTAANEDYKKKNSRLTKKLESKVSLVSLDTSFFPRKILHRLTPRWPAESEAELSALKVMVDNVIAFFYPGESSSEAHAHQMLDSLPNRSWEFILANMRQSESLALGILKSLYSHADLDTAGEVFALTCSDDEALKLVENSAATAGQVVHMLGVDMSLG
jgi:hypothetical protein